MTGERPEFGEALQRTTLLGPADAIAAESRATDARRKPRLGFLGVGWIGRQRMLSIAAAGDAQVMAIADSSREAALAAGAALAEIGAARKATVIASTLEELFAADLDGLVIATPSALHAEAAIAALEKGIAVFCQKPLARTADETRRIVGAARCNDRLLAVDLSYREVDAMRCVRDVVRRGEIGDVFAVDLVFHNAHGPDRSWFYDRALSGGGCVIDLGTHLVDLALWTLDAPAARLVDARLYSGGRLVAPPVDVCEDFAVARIVTGAGATIDLACSWHLAAGRDAVIGAAFHGTRGGVAMRNVGGSYYDFVAERYRGTTTEALSVPPDEWGGRAAAQWARRLAADPSYDPGVEHLMSVATVIDGIYGQ